MDSKLGIILLLLASCRAGMDFDHFPSFSEMEDYLHQVARNHSDLVELSVEGTTVEERPIYLLRIGSSPASPLTPAIFIDAGIHAREWIAPSTALFLVDRLLSLWQEEGAADVRTNVTYYIMPLLNPDGYEFSRTEGNRLWRKNRSKPPIGSDCYGIDLNRNYDVVGYGIGASDNPCAENYKGHEAGSEPEVFAASQVVFRHRNNIRVSLSLHSYGQKWLTSWGYTTEPAIDNDKLMDLGKAATKAMRAAHGRTYEVESAGAMYPAGGASDDFAKAQALIPYAVTLELPPDKKSFNDGFQIAASAIRGVGQDVWAGLRPVAEAALAEPLGPDRASSHGGGGKKSHLPLWRRL